MIYSNQSHYQLADLCMSKALDALNDHKPERARYFSDLARKHTDIARAVSARNERFRESLYRGESEWRFVEREGRPVVAPVSNCISPQIP